ncbi:MAG: methylated-DNA--[protein]-cysteine S-methyltransferase [Ignavibacteria bacterium]|nr:methylated-DNA--[protein]-cysteine S-methyltransferase [Ignavibacteria bacterium]
MIFYSKFRITQLKRSFFIAKNENGVCYISLSGDKNRFMKLIKAYLPDEMKHATFELSEEIKQIKEYFAGKREYFNMKVYLKGSGFQTAVWRELANVNYGETVSYTELARLAGNKKAFRAAATCCAVNPVPIIIPCHRVIAKDGSIGGFGGGLRMKRKMLEIENINLKKS